MAELPEHCVTVTDGLMRCWSPQPLGQLGRAWSCQADCMQLSLSCVSHKYIFLCVPWCGKYWTAMVYSRVSSSCIGATSPPPCPRQVSLSSHVTVSWWTHTLPQNLPDMVRRQPQTVPWRWPRLLYSSKRSTLIKGFRSPKMENKGCIFFSQWLTF